MSRVTYQQLTDLTGHVYRTLKKRMNGLRPAGTDGRSNFYDSVEALRRIYAAEFNVGEDEEKLNLSDEKARLAKLQADGHELKNQVARGELLPRDKVEAALVKHIMAARTRLMAIQAEVAPILLELLERDEATDVVARIDGAIRQALDDLSETKF